MSKHTPGPWTYRKSRLPTDGEYDFGIAAVIDNAPHCIAETFGRCGTNIRPNAEANARLIAAAPDLLAALSNLCETADAHVECADAVEQARVIIAKAQGTQS